ncbi:lectin [Lysobacter humi (ex Lee et al. 2017)]
MIPLLALAACTKSPEPDAAATPVPAAPTTSAPEASPAPATAAPQAPVATPPATGPNALARVDGYGDLRFGMDAAEARAAWGGELIGDEPGPENCAYLRPKWADGTGRFGLMFEGGKFVRYDVGTDREAAPGGGKVGMTRAQIEALYPGRVAVEPHKYVEGAVELRIADPAAKGRAILFETDAQGRVTHWRAGVEPQVDYVEGCA